MTFRTPPDVGVVRHAGTACLQDVLHQCFKFSLHDCIFVLLCITFYAHKLLWQSDCLELAVAKIYWSYVMFFRSLFSFSFSLFVLYVSNNSYTVMGGQHRWAPAFLAACHHIYFIIYYCIFLLWLIKLLLLLFYRPLRPQMLTRKPCYLQGEPRDTGVNLDTCRSLQLHRAVFISYQK